MKTKHSIDFSILIYAIITILIVLASASCTDNRSGQRVPTNTKKVRVQLAAFSGQYDPVYIRYVDTMYKVGDIFLEGRSKLIIVK